MLRVLPILILLVSWPGQAARGAVPGIPPYPASPQNRAPQTVSYIDVGPLRVGGSAATFNASSYFSDPDGDTLTYSVNSPSPSVATVSISGSTVTVAPVGIGTTGKIVVTARDPGNLTATQDFNVTVQNPPPPPPPNRAPTAVGSISNVILQVGGSSATRSVSGKFSDPDGDTLAYSVNSPNPAFVTVTISGSTVTITPVAAGTTGKIVVTARDPGGLTATQDFTATVESPPPPPPPVNNAPTAVGSISDVILEVGGSSATRSVSGKFSDPDNDTLTYSVNSPSPTVVTVSISGSTVTVAPVGAGTTGKIIVTARDPGGLTATQDFTATVEDPPPVPLNRAPKAVGSISDVTLQVGGAPATRSVSGKFSDPDGDTLTYSVNSPNPGIARVSISGSTVTITPVAAGSTGKIIVTATDPGDLSATQDFTATVETPNRRPITTGTITSRTVNVGASAFSVPVSGKFSDPDNDTLSFSASSDDTSAATVSISGGTLTVTPTTGGTATITVTATDPGRLTASLSFTVKVNRRPITTDTISNRTVNVGASAFTVSVSDKFSDPDGDNLTFSAESSDTSAATASISGGTLTVTPETGGTTTITVTASDRRLTASLSFSLKVNRRPIPVGSISDVTLRVGGSSAIRSVSGKFSDPDGDNLTYSVNSPNPGIATVSISGSTVTIAPVAAGTTGKIIVTATDPGDLSATQSFIVTVIPRCPARSGSIPDQTLTVGGSSASIDLAAYFSNLGGSSITHSSLNTTITTTSLSGDTLTVRPRRAGTTTVSVTVAKSRCANVTQSFTVTVIPPCPERSGSIPDQTLTVGGSSASINLAAYFSNLSGSSITHSSLNTMVTTTSLSGNTLTVRPRRAGTTTVSVTVAKSRCANVTQSFTVTVIPPCPERSGSIPDQTLTVGGSSASIDLAAYFSNLSGSSITHSSSDSTITTTSLSGDTLTVRPKRAGASTVSVTVAKSGCANVTQSFTVTVIPPCPAQSSSIPDQTLTVGGSSAAIDLSAYFSNLSGSTITHSSSDSTITTTSLAGDTLTVAPGTAGTDTVSVTVSKGDCDPVTQSFIVTVTPTCPQRSGSIPAQALTVGGRSAAVHLRQYFSLPLNFVPSYVVTSTDTTVATTSLAGDTLTVTPRAAGTDTVSVRVSKQDCDPATQSFTVTVRPAPPCPAAIAGATIPDQAMFAGADTTRIDLTRHFRHIGRNSVRITVTSPSPTVATTAIAGTSLVIDPKSAGRIAAVTVTVADTARTTTCSPASLSFMIEVKDPFLIPWSVSGENVYRLTGNVGIGVSGPDQKLVADGKIRAEEIRVPITPADYVFGADYDLMPLEDVARHVRDRGHLPGVASGAQMKANGIDVGRMQTLLLEKIEELSLHVIGQHEQLRAQGHSIDAQQRRLKLQNERIRRLERRLERLEQS